MSLRYLHIPSIRECGLLQPILRHVGFNQCQGTELYLERNDH